MRIFLGIVAFLLVETGGVTDTSDLQLIADDFQILSRVTNAIALQSAAIRKTIPARQVIVELLKITPGNFEEITKIKKKAKAIFVLDDFKKRLSKIPKEQMTPKQELDQFKSSLELINSSMSTEIGWALQADGLEKEVKKNLEELKANQSIFYQNCLGKELELITDLKDSLENIRKGVETKQENLEKLQSFLKNIDYFFKCYESISEYGQSLKALNVLKLSRDLQNLIDNALELSGSLELLPKHHLKKDLELSSPAWKNNPELLGSFGDKILHTCSMHVIHSDALDPPLPSFTIAFFKVEDLQKVFDDLESPWFKKHISRGSSIQELKKNLATFRELSQKMVTLDKTWYPFRRMDLSVADKDKLASVGFGLFEIESFVSNFSTDSILSSTGKILEECVKKPETTFQKTLENFKIQESQQTILLNSIQDLADFINFEILKVFQDIPKYVKCLKENIPKSPPQDVDTDTSVIQNLDEKFSKCSGNRLESFLGYFEKIVTKQDDMESAFKKFDGKFGKLKLKDVLEKSNVAKSVNCLRQKKFDLPNLLKMVKFISNLRDFPDAESIDFMTSYLSNLVEIKKALKIVEDAIHKAGTRPKRSPSSNNLVLALNNSEIHSANMAVCSLSLQNLAEIRKKRAELLKVGTHFDKKVIDVMRQQQIVGNFLDPRPLIDTLLVEADGIEKLAKRLRPQSLTNMSEIFQEVANIRGLIGSRDVVWQLSLEYSGTFSDDVISEWKTLSETEMDFVSYQSRLKDGYVTINALQNYFDQIFGHVKKQEPNTVVVEKTSHISYIVIICAILGTALLIFIIILGMYGLTKNGRERYQNLYLFYFGKPEDFEKRWRYSLFADREDGKNALLDAVREINRTNLLNVLKKGPYINAYNIFGNTALHVAVKHGHSELIDVLIEHGADRSLLNVKNKTPEQLIPIEYEKNDPEKAECYEKIQAIFKKYQKKKYRTRVPRKFPASSFHIFIDEAANLELTNRFMKKFRSITSFELLPTTTHLIVKTDKDGILEADTIELLSFIFNGIIIVKESWLIDCLHDEKVIEQDYNYLVERVKYKGVVYDTVLQWSMAMAKGEIPFLYGVYIVVSMKNPSNLFVLNSLIQNHGGIMLSEFPTKDKYRTGSHPYLHTDIGPLFIIHDEPDDTNLKVYINDKDKMYTVFTEEQFLVFMLKREVNRDTGENPITVAMDEEEL